MTTTSSTDSRLSKAAVARSLETLEVKPGFVMPLQILKDLLPDPTIALFFGQLFELDYQQLSNLLRKLYSTELIDVLFSGGHSTELQEYIIEVVPEHILATRDVGYSSTAQVPSSELLTQAVEAVRVEVAQSIRDVANSLGEVLGEFPTKYGQMTFEHLYQLNTQRNAIGTFGPVITRQAVAPRLVVLDVSGSMSAPTVQAIAAEVVALAYDIEASMAIVSNSATLYEPGAFTVESVLRDAEYSGTHYEQLLPVFHQDWETVVTIADYDSDYQVMELFRNNARGRVGQVLDFSLVNQPTFLSQCVGQIAREVKPVLIGSSAHVL